MGFMPVIRTLLASFGCTVSPRPILLMMMLLALLLKQTLAGRSVMPQAADVDCLSSLHVGYIVVAAVLLVLFVPTSLRLAAVAGSIDDVCTFYVIVRRVPLRAQRTRAAACSGVFLGQLVL